MKPLIPTIVAQAGALTNIRRDIHAHPELCFAETRTASVVATKLQEWGIEHHQGLGGTGVVGVLRAGTSKRSVGLRADMDALPMQELNTFAHASQYQGKMHACGHDGHVAMLLGAAQHLAQERNFDGTVYLIFQPAEEGGGGAREMIKDGLFTRFPADAVFGMHNWPGLEAGQFAASSGPVMASSSEFDITIQGKGSHAALAFMGVDPIPIACQLVLAFQTIVSRNTKAVDAAVLSVTMLEAGEATNVLPDFCRLQGTVRTFDSAVLDLVESRMKTLTEHICQAHGASGLFQFKRNYPPTVNHPKETAFVRQLIETWLGPEQLHVQEPTMGAEDFSYMLQAKPGCYFFIGNGLQAGSHRTHGHGEGPCTLHNPSYDFNDAIIPVGASFWVKLVQSYLSPEKQP